MKVRLVLLAEQRMTERNFTEKRAAAQKAEADFFALLKESGLAKPGAVWKEVRVLSVQVRWAH